MSWTKTTRETTKRMILQGRMYERPRTPHCPVKGLELYLSALSCLWQRPRVMKLIKSAIKMYLKGKYPGISLHFSYFCSTLTMSLLIIVREMI